jgi:hypothetical protein
MNKAPARASPAGAEVEKALLRCAGNTEQWRRNWWTGAAVYPAAAAQCGIAHRDLEQGMPRDEAQIEPHATSCF